MPLQLRRCAALLILVGIGAPAHAAEVSCDATYGQPTPEEMAKRERPSGARPTPGTCEVGLIRGTIIKGDYEKVLIFYRRNHPFLPLLQLISSGGDVEDAIKIGRLLRKYLVNAGAPLRLPDGRPYLPSLDPSQGAGNTPRSLCERSECICASACALIWFGGVDRFGRVGLHRPRTDDPAFKALAPVEASAVYRRMLADITRYLEEMEVPKQLIESMVATGSADIRWADSEKGLQRSPSIAEWKDASCGSFTEQESNTLSDLESRNRSQQDELLYKLLDEKLSKKKACERHLIFSHRERLAPP